MIFHLVNIALIVSFLFSSLDAYTPSTTRTLQHRGLVVRNSKRGHHLDDIVDGMTNNNVQEFLLCAAAAIVVAATPVLPVSAASYSDINRCTFH